MSLIEVTTALPPLQGLKNIRDGMDQILNNAGQRLQRCVRRHIRDIAENRHGTANRLGAQPTHHFKASDVLPADVSVPDSTVTVRVTTPGIVRAVRDVTILPKEAKSLAIPLHSTAYGIQPRELNDRGEYEMFRIKNKDTKEKSNILYRRGDDDELIPMYLMVRRVFQKKDESLMPTKTQMMEEAVAGADAAIKLLLEKK